MEFVSLCGSQLSVSRLGFGCCPMGRYGWGVVREDELLAAVDEALEGGINFFDTADIYGLGESERILGKALKGRRNRAVIATKFGMKREGGTTVLDCSPEWIVRAAEESLRRLQTDHIDLYQLHYYDKRTPWEDIIETLERLKQKGLICSCGVCNVTEEDLPCLKSFKGSLCAVQNEYSLAAREHEGDILALQEELQVTPVTWGSLGQGILTGKYSKVRNFGDDDRRSRPAYVNFHGERLQKNLRLAEKLCLIAGNHGKPAAAAALRWILDTVPKSVALAGVKRPEQVREQLKAADWTLGPDEWSRLDSLSGGGRALDGNK